MKILVPDHYSTKDIEDIKAVSKNITVAMLGIEKQRGGLYGVLYNFLPLMLFNKFIPLPDKKKSDYKITIDGKELTEQLDDIFILLSSWVINSEVLSMLLPFLPNLRWIHSTVTGVDHLLCPEIADKDNIQLTSSKGAHSEAVAEFVLALICTFIKRIPEHIYFQRKREWQLLLTDEFADKTIGIVGFGNIGKEIARKTRMLGMKVVAVRKKPAADNNTEGILLVEGLKELLSVSDFVVISAPLTKETSGIIGVRELRTMKNNAYIINISREEIIQKEALMRALKQKWIAGACIDVFQHNHLPKNSPYYSVPNLFITHHSAYYTPNAHKRIFAVFLANLKRFVNGEELFGKIDKKSGY